MGRRIVLLAVLGGGLAGCGARELPKQEDDLLVLELGGNAKTLRNLLHLVETPAVSVPVRAPSEPAASSRMIVPRRAETPTAEYFEVALQPGQTLYALCREQLDDASRWREVMALNALQESDLRRLPAGKMIRLPRR